LKLCVHAGGLPCLVSQLSIHEQILTMESAQSLIDSRLVVTDIALAFIRPKHGAELKTILGSTIGEILKMQDLDLCIDPVEVSTCRVVLTIERLLLTSLRRDRYITAFSTTRKANPAWLARNLAT
jgi:hypothetical protein